MTAPRIVPGGIRDLGPLTWAFAKLAGRVTGTEPPAIFTVLGRHGPLFRGWLHFAAKLMPGGRLARRESELVILRVAHRAGSAYEFEHHARLGARAGLTQREIEQVATDAGQWNQRDRLLLKVTDELHHTRDLSDGTWAALSAEFDERTCIEILMLVGHYEMLATTLGVLRIRPDRPRQNLRPGR